MFTAEIHHTRETLKKFTTVQYDTFEFAGKLILAAVGAALIVFGAVQLSVSNALLGVICLALGCILITNLNYKAQSVADSVAEAMKGAYPALKYTFADDGFRDGEGRPEVKYKKIFRLIADEQYLYIFTSKASGYMMEIGSVGGDGGAEDLKSFLSEKSGLDWTRPLTLASFSLRDALRLLRQKKEKK